MSDATGAVRQRAAVRVPATSANLGPGFDAFGVALGLHLWAEARPRGGEDVLRVRTHGEGAGELAEDDTNLVWRSFLTPFAHAGEPVPDVAIEVTNDIPLERGLGSSSAAIVAGLALARRLSSRPLSDPEIVRLATEIEGHPDNVAPAVLGGLVVAARAPTGHTVVRRTQPHSRLRPVALVPTSRQLTTAARAVIPESLPREDVVDQAARAGHLVPALAGVWPAEPQLAGDLLHEPARSRAMPASGELLEALRSGGVHAWLSGAGPSVCAAVPARDATVHDRIHAIGHQHGFAVRELSWDLGGATVLT